jgi:pantetheine-phosphate adenylyltransferase
MGKIAIYPGTFDPLTNGHLDVIKRASRLFDKLIVAVACNERKTPLFTVEQRMAMIRQAVKGLPGVSVDSFSDLLVDYAGRKKIKAVIRGLRVISDFEYEFQMALMNRKLSPAMETVFLMPSEQYTYLNSGLVREIARLGGDIRELVPANVAKQLKEMFPR